MNTYQFKTNINCGGCVAQATGTFSKEQGIRSWAVDTNDPRKILTVETESLSREEILAIVSKAGFRAEPLVQDDVNLRA